MRAARGVVGPPTAVCADGSGTTLERAAEAGESPLRETVGTDPGGT